MAITPDWEAKWDSFFADMGDFAPDVDAASKKQVGGDHYVNMGVQPWDAMESWLTPEQFQGFLQGNAIKYLARWQSKGGVEDLRKARHYLDKLIEEVGEP